MRSKLFILFTAILAMLGLVVPASVASASPADDVKSAVEAAASSLPAGDQAMANELIDKVEAVVQAAGEVGAATPETWDPEHQALADALQALIDWAAANWSLLWPIVSDLLMDALPALAIALPAIIVAIQGPLVDLLGFIWSQIDTLAPQAVDLLCEAGSHMFPSFAGLIGTLCGFIGAILGPVLDLLPVLAPIILGLAGPIVGVVCDLAATFLPSQAALINGICGFLEDLLSPPAPTTTTTTTLAP